MPSSTSTKPSAPASTTFAVRNSSSCVRVRSSAARTPTKDHEIVE
jgi:hypothetical protein